MHPTIGRRERRRGRVRRALLDSAITLFAERGIHGTRVEDITERTDLGKGAFYNYFGSKDALVGELLLEAIELLEREHLTALGDEGDIPSRLAQLVRLHDAFFEEHPEYVLLFHQARGLIKVERGDPPKLQAIFADYLGRIGARLLPAGMHDDWSPEQRADLAAMVVGAIAGYRSYRLAAGLSPSTATVTEALTEGIPKLMQMRRSPPR